MDTIANSRAFSVQYSIEKEHDDLMHFEVKNSLHHITVTVSPVLAKKIHAD